MSKIFITFGLASIMYLVAANSRGMIVGQLFGLSLKETVTGATTRGVYHK